MLLTLTSSDSKPVLTGKITHLAKMRPCQSSHRYAIASSVAEYSESLAFLSTALLFSLQFQLWSLLGRGFLPMDSSYLRLVNLGTGQLQALALLLQPPPLKSRWDVTSNPLLHRRSLLHGERSLLLSSCPTRVRRSQRSLPKTTLEFDADTARTRRRRKRRDDDASSSSPPCRARTGRPRSLRKVDRSSA